MFTLPTRTDSPYFDFEIELDGLSYVLTFRWNGRDESWFLDVADDAGTVVLAGRKLALGSPLLRRFLDGRLPAGELVLLDTTGQDLEAGIQDLGGRVHLNYATAAELAALLAGAA